METCVKSGQLAFFKKVDKKIGQNGALPKDMCFTFGLTAALRDADLQGSVPRPNALERGRPFWKVNREVFMTKRILLAAAAVAAVAAVPASAVTVIAERGTLANFGSPYSAVPGAKLFTFNSGSTATEIANLQAAGFTVSGTGTVGVRTGSQGTDWQQPTPGDGSAFASVQANSSVSISGSTGYNGISLYLGSVDNYNSISVLNTAGQVIRSYTGSELLAFATPAGTANGTTSYRITFVRGANDVAFGGLAVQSTTSNAAEFDNLVFAVPEPSTWALMLAGFGMVGMSMRARRRRTSVVFG